jgi:uncharacterized membrane protein
MRLSLCTYHTLVPPAYLTGLTAGCMLSIEFCHSLPWLTMRHGAAALLAAVLLSLALI